MWNKPAKASGSGSASIGSIPNNAGVTYPTRSGGQKGSRIKSYDASSGTITVTCSLSATAEAIASTTDGASCSVSVSYTAAISNVEILRKNSSGTYAPLTGDNAKCLPGELIDLSVSGVAINSPHSWTDPGNGAFKNYDVSLAENQLISLSASDKNQPTFKYHYTYGDDAKHKVSCQVTAAGQPVTVEDELEIVAPESVFKGKSGVILDNALQLVPDPGNSDYSQGMDFKDSTVKTLKGVAGEFGFFQVGTISRQCYLNVDSMGKETDGYGPASSNVSGLDAGAPMYSIKKSVGTVISSPANPSGDSPGESTIGFITGQQTPVFFKKIKADDQFTTWLMYLPPGASSCWVPLRKFDWRWGGSATDTGVAATRNIVVTSKIIPGDKAGEEARDHPQWSGVIDSHARYVPIASEP